MSGNTFGRLFCVSSFGESHGAAIGCIVDGCPPNLALSEADIQPDLDRRRPGKNRFETQRQEEDKVQILSGVYEGKTTGTPIALLIHNTDQRSKDYAAISQKFRPGHADYTYWHKYGIRDPRGGGRSSARETAARVAAGAIAKKYLEQSFGMVIRAYLAQLGTLPVPFVDWAQVNENEFFAANPAMRPQLADYLDQLRRDGDSCGARVNVVASAKNSKMPVGWGNPVFDRLDATIAAAMMSINAVKGVEIGDGFASVAQRGSYHGDELTPTGFSSNHAGGILGGISSGQDILVSVALKPTSSIRIERNTIDTEQNPTTISTLGRHDPCVGIRAVPIVEAMLALALMDAYLHQRGQCG